MEEALELRAAARKRAHKFGLFASSSKRARDRTEAEDLFTQAANRFLALRQFSDAADCFEHASANAESVYTAASLMIEAAKAWRSGNERERSIKAYADAIARFAHKGPLRRAALVAMDLAKVYEEDNRLEPALKTWQRAVDWFEEQHEENMAGKARQGLADCAVSVKQYDIAIQNYERAAEEASHEVLTRYMLKQYLFKAGLCRLAQGDVLGMRTALESHYVKWDRAFTAAVEYTTLKNLTQALAEMDLALFEQTLWKHDKKKRLDKWHLELCLRIKDRFTSNDPVDELI